MPGRRGCGNAALARGHPGRSDEPRPTRAAPCARSLQRCSGSSTRPVADSCTPATSRKRWVRARSWFLAGSAPIRGAPTG